MTYHELSLEKRATPGSERIEWVTQMAYASAVATDFRGPHSPWPRGSTRMAAPKNINGLIRRYLPKGTNLSKYNQKVLHAMAQGHDAQGSIL